MIHRLLSLGTLENSALEFGMKAKLAITKSVQQDWSCLLLKFSKNMVQVPKVRDSMWSGSTTKLGDCSSWKIWRAACICAQSSLTGGNMPVTLLQLRVPRCHFPHEKIIQVGVARETYMMYHIRSWERVQVPEVVEGNRFQAERTTNRQ